MGIRKSIASGLIAAATQLQKDQSKEQLIRKTNDVRRSIARFIEPKESTRDQSVNEYFNSVFKWSVKAGPGVQTLRHFLPPAEMGTAHMEKSNET